MALSNSKAVICAVILGLIFAFICYAPQSFDERMLRLHEDLLSFERRGQATIELFGPLSTLLAASHTNWVAKYSEAHVVWPVVGILWIVLCRDSRYVTLFNKVITSLTFGAVILSTSVAEETQYNVLTKCYMVGDACLLLAVLASSASVASFPYLVLLRFLGVGEALVLWSFGFGINFIDIKIAYFLVFIARARDFAVRIADKKHSATKLFWEGALSFLIHAVCWPLLFLYLVGALLPRSEVAAGGNYNLRFLSPQARRQISPFPEVREIGIYSERFYTLYLPRAGFLWSDDMVWEQQLPERLRHKANVHNEDDPYSPWSTDGSFRVYFDDTFAERYPWVFQPLSGTSSGAPLQSHSKVRIYDPTAEQYLCMMPSEKLASEAMYFADREKEGDKDQDRFRVGVIADPTAAACNWTFLNEAYSEGGFALYNSEKNCHLASTFRTLPGSTAPPSDDAILRALNLKLEASCTQKTTARNSRLFVIDNLISKYSNSRDLSQETSIGILSRAFMYFQARSKLYDFRGAYDHLSEFPEIGAREEYWSWSQLSSLICIVYLTLWTLEAFARQRHLLVKRTSASPYGLRALFVLAHTCMYQLSGQTMPYASRAAGLISLHGLFDIIN